MARSLKARSPKARSPRSRLEMARSPKARNPKTRSPKSRSQKSGWTEVQIVNRTRTYIYTYLKWCSQHATPQRSSLHTAWWWWWDFERKVQWESWGNIRRWEKDMFAKTNNNNNPLKISVSNSGRVFFLKYCNYFVFFLYYILMHIVSYLMIWSLF